MYDQYTAEQWADRMDFYLSGVENGRADGYRQGVEDAYNLALRQWCDVISDVPYTSFIQCPRQAA
jgi:hypothetical protein